jgi:hypothetical protein
LSNSIVDCSPRRENGLANQGSFAAHRRLDVRPEPPQSTAFCHGRDRLDGASGGEIPASQTTIPKLPQCAKLGRQHRAPAYPQSRSRRRIYAMPARLTWTLASGRLFTGAASLDSAGRA